MADDRSQPVSSRDRVGGAAGHPVRTCIGCRTRRPDTALVRVAHVDGELTIGERGGGRGAWLCPRESCIRAAGKTKAFSRALRSKLADAVCADTLLGWLGKPAH